MRIGQARIAPEERAEGTLELGAGARHPGVRMVGGDVKHARDVGWRESVPDGEFEHFAICLAEAARGGADELADLLRVHGAAGIGVQHRFVRLAQDRGPFTHPDQSLGLVAGYRVEPSSEAVRIPNLMHPL